MDTRPQENTGSLTSRRWFAGIAAFGGLGLLAGKAQAQGWGPRMHRMDPDEIARRMDARIGRMVANVGGTPEQKDRIAAIVRSAMAEMRPLREQLRQARRIGLEILAAPVIDRAALERLRASQMQLADSKSRRMTQALADAAEVLSPEQRAKVADRMRQRMERRWGR